MHFWTQGAAIASQRYHSEHQDPAALFQQAQSPTDRKTVDIDRVLQTMSIVTGAPALTSAMPDLGSVVTLLSSTSTLAEMRYTNPKMGETS